MSANELSVWIEGGAPGLRLLTGPNGSGKSRAACALVESVADARLLSAESQQAFYERELSLDEGNFRGGIDTSSKVSTLLGAEAPAHPLFSAFRLGPLWERGYRKLSTGEARKVLLLQAVLARPSLLVLDEPFDGLDVAACEDLGRAIAHVAELMNVVLVGSFEPPNGDGNAAYPFDAIREVALLENGRVTFLGTPRAWQERVASKRAPRSCPPIDSGSWFEPLPENVPLVELKHGRVSYGDSVVFDNLDFTIRVGEHTLIEGPNGSGKSTLLELLTGDHPQAYANDLSLFGRRRGSGESVWDIKKKVGLVSGRLHRDYRVGGSVEEVLMSGLFDSIGVYQAPEPSDRAKARAWLAWLELGIAPNTSFRELSYGFQRLVLVARAAIKVPPLVVMDEPTHGLDAQNRARVLELVESLCSQRKSTVLFVTHRPEERAFWEERALGARLSLAPCT